MSVVGLRVSLTGRVDGASRARFRERVEAAGATYAPILDEDVDVLVVGADSLASKVTKAEELGVRVADWSTFRASLEAPETSVPLADEHGEARPALELDNGHLLVTDRALPLRDGLPDARDQALVPDLARFAHYTLDGPTLALLRFLARAVALRQPCLIEGDTATSKTSAVQYLASRLGQPVARLNLNGQTDTGELVGKFVPAADGGWVFQEGLVPQAMRRGWWLVLDEVNLADPAVLERLNPVVERHPSLVLTESDGTRIGGVGAPVHPAFRVFATMNPAEYEGRSVLSPAWRDRFVATFQARAPGERELLHLLHRAVFGEQPLVRLAGERWRGAVNDAPSHGTLAVPGVRALLSRLAALQAGLATMSRPGDGSGPSLGVRRRETYVFSRRGMLAWLDALASARRRTAAGHDVGFAEAPEATVVEVLDDLVVQRIRGDEDRALVRSVLRSLGLTATSWVDFR